MKVDDRERRIVDAMEADASGVDAISLKPVFRDSYTAFLLEFTYEYSGSKFTETNNNEVTDCGGHHHQLRVAPRRRSQ